MWFWAASSGAQDAQNQLVLAIVGAAGLLLVAIATGLFNVWAAKQNRGSSSPESATTLLFERTAVLSARADDSDERDETQDRRLDQIERALDIDNINWRHPTEPK